MDHWGEGIQHGQGRSKSRTDKRAWHCFGQWNPRGLGKMTGEEHQEASRLRAIPLFRPYGRSFVSSVSLAQSGFHSVWRGWGGSAGSMERGAWNMEAPCIRHTRWPYERGDIHVQSEFFVSYSSSHTITPIGVQLWGRFGLGLVFPKRPELNRTSHIHDSTRGQAPSAACAKPR
jgi:hypothetical protein